MKKIWKSICFAMLLTCMMSLSVKAASPNATWMKSGGDRWRLQDQEGTDLEAYFDHDNHVLYIQGKGAIPSYSSECLGNRPWHGKSYYKLVIGSEVTSVGANAFSCNADLYNVDMYTSTFIEDASSFAGAKQDCCFTMIGTSMARRDIGTIPYNSVDQFVNVMRKHDGEYKFYFSNQYLVRYVNYGSTPKWSTVFTTDVNGSYTDPDHPLTNFDTVITCNTPDGYYANKYEIRNYRQGLDALKAFAAFIGNDTFACTYTMTAYQGNERKRTFSGKPLQYTIVIPASLQYPGRQFKLLQIAPGAVNVLADEDAVDGTMTFTTNYLSTGYALVYSDTLPIVK